MEQENVVADIVRAIRGGVLDDELHRIGEEINARYKARRMEAARDLRVGMKVRVLDLPNLKNRDMVGRSGEVVRRNQQTVTVNFDGVLWKMPATILVEAV
jgi:RNase P/RNase MRP subunit p29